MFEKGQRVQVSRPGSPEGTVSGAEFEGKAYVRLDSGSAGSFAVGELTAIESKAWPPAGIETKAQA